MVLIIEEIAKSEHSSRVLLHSAEVGPPRARHDPQLSSIFYSTYGAVGRPAHWQTGAPANSAIAATAAAAAAAEESASKGIVEVKNYHPHENTKTVLNRTARLEVLNPSDRKKKNAHHEATALRTHTAPERGQDRVLTPPKQNGR